ncbi:MAG: hypothetical protein FJY17_00185 [Bacteroidetes bacterium]|nr:hypothetical protein [Bacteroidota bacterium]
MLPLTKTMKITYVRNGTMRVTDPEGNVNSEVGLAGDEFELELVTEKGRFLDLRDKDGSVITVARADVQIE